jgi:hypothetical protein
MRLLALACQAVDRRGRFVTWMDNRRRRTHGGGRTEGPDRLDRAGYALGTRWQQVEQYSTWFDYAIGLVFVIAIVAWVVKKRRAAAPESDRASGGRL